MAINFPDNPNTNDLYTVDGKSWRFTGTRWESVGGAIIPTIRTVTADTTLEDTDQSNIIRFNGTSAQILTVEDVLDVGGSVEVIQDNSGSVEFQSGQGVTLLSSTGFFDSKGQNSVVTLRCVASGQYRITGDLSLEGVPLATGGTITSTDEHWIHTFTSSGTFTPLETLSTVDILVIAGGGSGATSHAGGGGAGGYRTYTGALSPQSYVVTVGAGGAAVTGSHIDGNKGSNSSIGSLLTSTGGGGGARANTAVTGGVGGSGGGGGRGGGGGAGNQGGYSPVEGYAGGGSSGSASSYGGGGGGGAGAAGSAGTNLAGGTGGAGRAWLDGVYRAGGGGGGANVDSPDALGGTGGGGRGGEGLSVSATNGDINTGSGGGGGNGEANPTSGAGGSGVVIVRYLKA